MLHDTQAGMEDRDHALGAGHVFVPHEGADAFRFEDFPEIGYLAGCRIRDEFDHARAKDKVKEAKGNRFTESIQRSGKSGWYRWCWGGRIAPIRHCRRCSRIR